MSLYGLDEAGRGPWAGPLFVGVVSLGNNSIDGLNDSKKLTASKRQKLCKEILEIAEFVGVGAASSLYIDKHGLTQSTIYASNQAIAEISSLSKVKFIIDGNVDYLPQISDKQLVVKADSKYPCVSAASIIAKVYRDHYMLQLAKRYPEYGFDKHFGYGTNMHRQALESQGLCPEHRRSFKPITKLTS